MAANSTGLYLGTDNVDVIALSGTFQKPALVQFGRVQLPTQLSWRSLLRAEEGAISAGSKEATTPKEVGKEIAGPIQSLLVKLGLPSKHVQAAIAAESVIIRYFQMPAIPPHERKLAVSFEAKKYLPFKLEELVTDFQAIIHKSDPTLMRVMFFGIKKAALDAVLALTEAVQLKPFCLEPAPISLMRLLRQNGQIKSGEVAAVLNLEHDNATINIARDDLLYLSRNVTVLSPPEGGEDQTAELLDALINETRVSIDYYRRRFLGEPSVGKVLLFGKEIEPKRVEELGEALELPVEVGDPFRGIDEANNVPAGLAVATGLALRGLERDQRGATNLLPTEKRGQGDSLIKPLALEALAAVLVLILWYGISLMDLGSWEGKLLQIRSNQVEVKNIPTQTPIPSLQALGIKYSKEVNFFEQLAQAEGINAAILSELTRLLPKETWLEHTVLTDVMKKQGTAKTSLTFERHRTLRLAGWAFQENRDEELHHVNALLGTLRENPLFSATFTEFSLDSVQRAEFHQKGATEFKLACATDPEDIKPEDTEGYRRRGRRSR